MINEGNQHLVHKDAFSSGQLGSKIWLCEELEKLNLESESTYIYAGWYGITAFLLLSRGNFSVSKIRSIDLDPSCQPVADMINENWLINEWQFKALTGDCNVLGDTGADLIINTSTEHFNDMTWFDDIPSGTRVILQGNNMPHDDHFVHSDTLERFVEQYPLTQYLFKGGKDFVYPTWGFTRYMVIGVK